MFDLAGCQKQSATAIARAGSRVKDALHVSGFWAAQGTGCICLSSQSRALYWLK